MDIEESHPSLAESIADVINAKEPKPFVSHLERMAHALKTARSFVTEEAKVDTKAVDITTEYLKTQKKPKAVKEAVVPVNEAAHLLREAGAGRVTVKNIYLEYNRLGKTNRIKHNLDEGIRVIDKALLESHLNLFEISRDSAKAYVKSALKSRDASYNASTKKVGPVHSNSDDPDAKVWKRRIKGIDTARSKLSKRNYSDNSIVGSVKQKVTEDSDIIEDHDDDGYYTAHQIRGVSRDDYKKEQEEKRRQREHDKMITQKARRRKRARGLAEENKEDINETPLLGRGMSPEARARDVEQSDREYAAYKIMWNKKYDEYGKPRVNEETEQIDELSRSTLKSYRRNYLQGVQRTTVPSRKGKVWVGDEKKLKKRIAGRHLAGRKLGRHGPSPNVYATEQTEENQ